MRAQIFLLSKYEDQKYEYDILDTVHTCIRTFEKNVAEDYTRHLEGIDICGNHTLIYVLIQYRSMIDKYDNKK